MDRTSEIPSEIPSDLLYQMTTYRQQWRDLIGKITHNNQEIQQNENVKGKLRGIKDELEVKQEQLKVEREQLKVEQKQLDKNYDALVVKRDTLESRRVELGHERYNINKLLIELVETNYPSSEELSSKMNSFWAEV